MSGGSSDSAKPATDGLGSGRHFIDVSDDLKLGMLVGRPSDSEKSTEIMLLMHQTGLSAEGEFGKVSLQCGLLANLGLA